ncbi:MAG: hypothetical protein ACF8R7_13490 [Phycisphaerales bacterium JB039]
MEQLARIRHVCGLYTADHPAVDVACRQVAGAIRSACREGAVRAELLGDAGAADPVSRDLRNSDIGAVEFIRSIPATNLRKVGELLHAATREGLRGEGLARHVEKASGGAIRLEALQTAGLRAIAGARTQGATIGVQDVLHNLTGAGDIDPADLAVAIDSGALEGGLPGYEELTEHVKTLALQMADGPTLQRLRTFVAALSPKLRRQLLHLDPSQLSRSIALLERFAETMSLAEVLDAIEAIDQTPRPAPPEALMLMRRLLSIGEGSGVTDELERLKMRLEDSDFWTSDGVAGSVEELLQRRSDEIYASDEYNAHLRDLSRGVESPALGKPGSQVETIKIGRVACEVLRRSPDAPPGIGALQRVCDSLDDLIEAAEFELVFGAVLAASGAAYQRADESRRRSAEALLDRVRDPAVIDAVLAVIAARASLPPGAEALLGAAGREAVMQIARFLRTPEAQRARAPLASYLGSVSPEAIVSSLARLAEPNPKACHALLDAAARRSDVLEQAIGHARAEVRALAIDWLASARDAPAAELRMALLDPDERVRGVALGCIERHPKRAPVKDIGRILRAERGMPRFGPAERQRLVQILSQTDSGMRELGRSLRLLAGMLRPRHAARAQWLARALRPWADHPRIRLHMRTWKQSPGRLVLLGARLIGGGWRS